MLRILLSVLLLAPVAFAQDVPVSRAEIQLSFSPVVRKAAPAVVNIYARRIVASRVSPFAGDPFFSQFFGAGPTRPRVENSLGSGVLLSEDGYAVSNYHVVGEADEIRVVLSDRREFDADIVLADAEVDLAVMKLRDAEGLPALAFADSDALQVGDLVLAIGNPFGVGQTVTSGIVSGLARTGAAADPEKAYFIQTDAPINPGNSGGALVDMAGRLIGINTSILTRSGGSNGIGFAIPSNLVHAFVEQAEVGNTRLVRPWSGVYTQTIDDDLAAALDLDYPQGIVVLQMHPRSPFASAGLEPGDVITAIDGKPVNAPAELRYRLVILGIGKEAVVSYLRAGSSGTVQVSLIEPPDDPPRDLSLIETPGPFRGMEAANVNPAVIEEMGLGLDAEGVVVVSVRGNAQRIGLRPGDILTSINTRPLGSVADLKRAAGRRADIWQIEFLRNGQKAVLRVR